MKRMSLLTPLILLALPTLAQTPPSSLPAAKTVQVTETISSISAPAAPLKPVAVMTVKISRPGFVHLEQTRVGADAAAGPDMMLVSDGKTLTEYTASRKQFRKQDAPPDLAATLPGLAPVPSTVKSTAVTLDGKPMLLFVSTRSSGASVMTKKLWKDAATGLPARESIFLTRAGKLTEVQRTVFTDWILDATLDPSLFAFTPPAGATEYAEPKLLASGVPAPDFTVQDRNGKSLKLSDYRGKVVVLDFWATWCGPCQESLPHTNAVARQFRGKDVVVLAVNVWDTKTAFLQWLPSHKNFDAIKFAVDTSAQGQDVASHLYNVTGIPTQYVIGKDGSIMQSFVGFGGPTDDLAKAITKAGAGT